MKRVRSLRTGKKCFSAKLVSFAACTLLLVTLLAVFNELIMPSSSLSYEVPLEWQIPDYYWSIIERLHLYVHETGKDYVYPDPHVKILAVFNPPKGNLMVFLGFEDVEDLDYAQWNDCFLNLESWGEKFYIEGRLTGAYHKTLWFDRPTKGRFDIVTYFDRVWWSCDYNPATEEFHFEEYW